VYTILVDEVKTRTLADRQIAALYNVFGEGVTALPNLYEEREQFDKWLYTEEIEVDEQQSILLRALGLRER
jgi:hypothetical protein